ncbi:uncharacterized aarF domain-containing protein kinase 2 [Pyxicephalus adspersus]|uniref:uncharacterized aarF domain-containing protein kinase 2 n=1 Tax=Pyxicephalus adspersus TaxID=30357 RepID=UPI003B58F7CA
MATSSSRDHQKSKDSVLKKTFFLVRLVVRSCVLFLKFGPLLLTYPLTFLSDRFHTIWLHLLLKATESSGPACIKLGQWASTRRDLFSERFCAKFSKLHVKVAPHPWGYTEICLKKAFGDNYGHVLKFPSREPWLSLTEIVEEFEKLMTRQIDLRYEARNLEMFHQKFEKMDFIKFPIPLRPFVTRNILVETFEEGEPLTLYLQEAESNQIKQRIAAMGVDMLLKMGETVAELILYHARANQCIDVEAFKSQMAELVNEARRSKVSLGKVRLAIMRWSFFTF